MTSIHRTESSNEILSPLSRYQADSTVASRTEPEPDLRAIRVERLPKTIGLALLLTGLFLIPQFLIHIPTGIIAPISAGITTGGIRKVRPWESFCIGLILFLVITVPAPVAYVWFGFANHLHFMAIFAFAFAFGIYYGTLIGLFSWIGSRVNQSKIGG